jgi:hypothetical protein
VGGIFNLESIRHAGLVATQIQLQASLRDADPIDSQPGDKSPGYYRVSLRDEVKTGFQTSKLQCPEGAVGLSPGVSTLGTLKINGSP